MAKLPATKQDLYGFYKKRQIVFRFAGYKQHVCYCLWIPSQVYSLNSIPWIFLPSLVELHSWGLFLIPGKTRSEDDKLLWLPFSTSIHHRSQHQGNSHLPTRFRSSELCRIIPTARVQLSHSPQVLRVDKESGSSYSIREGCVCSVV